MKLINQLYKFATLLAKKRSIFLIGCFFILLSLSSLNFNGTPEYKESTLQNQINIAKISINDYPEINQDSKQVIIVKRNDSLISILNRANINRESIKKLIRAKNSKLLTKIKIGEKFIIKSNMSGDLKELIYQKQLTKGVEVKLLNAEYLVKPYKRETEIMPIYKKVVIEESLYVDGLKAKIPDSVIMDMAYIYGWDIDFTYDLRPGDSYSLIYEEILLDGERIKNGDILIAKFYFQGKELIATRFDQENGKSEYFSPNGDNMKKAFLRSPVNFSYISSRYNLKRKHPILYKIKAHTGVDYAAAKGSPVIATGDGTISYSSLKGGYGNLVEIKHSEDYATRYAHLNKIHKRASLGKKVKQGEVIGYVGKTGMATGYHLHYEFHVNGRHTNPLTVKFPNAKPVEKNELKNYTLNFLSRKKMIDNYEKLESRNEEI
tara:strand:+ start:1512 stop:2813 length:1302 start_codon:yes stop_codon:yes gene_type:complete